MMRKATLLLVSLLSFSVLFAQEKTITGKVNDETGAGLPGATVQLKGTQTGTMTDVNGNFTLKVPASGGTLVVSYVGYTPQEVEIGDKTSIELSLEPDVKKLEEVVVVGYGVQKKSLVTGSISRIDSKDITSIPTARVEQALQGKTAGVYIAQNSGAPGGSMLVKIRGFSSIGKNDPLFIVNGVKVSNIDFLSPNDIESVEILKDAASAAIYGSEGANGVVIITTKKGVKGESKVNYNYYHGWQSVVHTIQPMNAEQYLAYQREAYELEYKYGLIKENIYKSNLAKLDTWSAEATYTNWIDEIFQDAPMDEHNISFTTSTEKTTSLVSASYLNQDGIVGGPKANYERFTFNISNTNKVKDWLQIETNINYSKSTKHNLLENSEFGNGIINHALYMDPTIPIFYESEAELPTGWRPEDKNGIIYKSLVRNKEGKIYHASLNTPGVSNPLAMIDIANNVSSYNRLLGNIKTDIDLPFNIKYTNFLGVNYALRIDDIFYDNFYWDESNKNVNDTNKSVRNAYVYEYKYNFDNYLQYTKEFTDFSVNALIGMSYEDYLPTFISGKNYHIASADKAYLSNGRTYANYPISLEGGIGTGPDPLDNILVRDNQEKQYSYFGRVVLSYKEIVMLQSNIRKDRTSYFGPDRDPAKDYFPSVSGGINLHKIDAIATAAPWLSNAKLRGSWGKNGNKQILPPFSYLTLVEQIQTGPGKYSTNILRPGNPSLNWEISEQFDFGLDVSVLNNKIITNIDYFIKTTKGQLNENAKIPDYQGYSNPPFENNGEIKNEGLELELGYREMEKEFKYSVSLNISYLKNKVTKYGSEFKNGYKLNVGDNATRYQPGYPVWYFYGFKTLGVFQDTTEIKNYVNNNGEPYQPNAIPGDLKYEDVNKDGQITVEDMTMIGKPFPDWTFGLNLSLNYKWIDFGMFIQGTLGNDIYFSAIQVSRPKYNKPDFYYTERWHGPGTSNWFPRPTINSKGDINNFRSNSVYVHDGDYLRIKNITLGFTLPKNLTQKVGISKLRLYTTANNIFTLTKYKGTDPEVGQLFGDYNYNAYGVDRAIYPQPKMITVGLNVEF